MSQKDLKEYKFDSETDPSDEQMEQLMENAAEKVRRSNRESDRRFFNELRNASDVARRRQY